MASTRSYEVIVGPETSAAPTVGTPSADEDIITKGYSDTTYAKREFWGASVANTTALKAIGTTGANSRVDTQVRLKDDNQTLWKYDSSSSATEDGTTVITPDGAPATGRWLAASGSSGSSSGTASASELLQTQNQLAAIGFPTRQLDNSLRANGLEIPAHKYSTSRLIENYTSGGASIKVVHNPVVVFDTDKDYDSIAGWAAVGAGTTLAATAGSTKVGSNHFSFNKDGSAVSASIRHTLAAQTLSVGANYRVYFWVDMPSITGLSNIFVKIMGAATTDFSKWDLTTNSAGGALATGYNLMFVDIANTAASSTGGTAWTTTQLARYVEVGVTASSGQTYTGIKFAGLWFSQGAIAAFGNKYLEYTGYDTSNKNDFKMASSNTTLDGIVTLSSTVAQNYTAGISAATATSLVRSTLSWSQSGLIGFDTLTSGTIALEQEMRLTKVIRESLSGNYGAYVDMFTPQIYKVTVVGGSTIGVDDSENNSANLLNGDSIHIFTTTHSDGVPNFTLLATRAMTAGSSHSSGTTTLTVSPSGIAVGDYVVKQHLAVSASVVAASADESFSALSYDTTPNGAQLIGSRSYPNPQSVWAHWLLGAPTDFLALKDNSGNSRTLVKVSTPNLQSDFKSGKYSATSFATTKYLRTAGGLSTTLDGNGEMVQISFWVYFDGTNAAARNLITNTDSASGGGGWICRVGGSATQITLLFQDAGVTTSTVTSSVVMSTGTWNHVVIQMQRSVYHRIYVNGVLSSTTAGTLPPLTAAQAMYLGVVCQSTVLDDGAGLVDSALNMKMGDLILWRDGILLSQSDVNYLNNAGVPQFYGYTPSVLRNEYALTGQSGQRISMKAKLNRSTSAVSPYILDAGIIKTG